MGQSQETWSGTIVQQLVLMILIIVLQVENTVYYQ